MLNSKFIAFVVCAFGTVNFASAQDQQTQPADGPAFEPVRILFVASSHFGNQARDLNNPETDDVLAPRRQAELEALSNALVVFRPTAVAVEREAPPPYDDPKWKEFDHEMLRTERDERVQIGFRVARDADIQRVYAIDETTGEGEPVYHPIVPLKNFAEKTGQATELNAILDLSDFVEEFAEVQSAGTIPELLMLLNSERVSSLIDNQYWSALTFGQGEEQPGPELSAYWFLRNAKIFNKLVQVTKPGDRVVVVYGAGHGPWLREIIQRTEGYELEPVAPYLEAAATMLGNKN